MKQHMFLIALLLLILTPAGATASGPVIGGELGIASSHFAFESREFLPLPEDSYKSTIWVRGGPRLRLDLGSGFAILTGLSLELGGFKAELGPGITVTERIEYLTVPLIAEFVLSDGKVRPFGRIGMEPGVRMDVDYIFEHESQNIHENTDADHLYPSWEWTAILGGGIRVSRQWDLQLMYRHGLTNVNNSLNRNTHAIHNRGITLGVLYWLR